MNTTKAEELAAMDSIMLLDITYIEDRIKDRVKNGHFYIMVTLRCAEYSHSARVKEHFRNLGYDVNEQEYPSILHISWRKPK